MTNEHNKAMVLRDSEGNYYVLPLDVMERARVPAERVAEVEAAIGEVTAYAMGSAVGGGILELDGSFLVDEEVVDPLLALPENDSRRHWFADATAFIGAGGEGRSHGRNDAQ